MTEPPETVQGLPSVRITLPDGATVTSADPGVDDALSEVVGRKVTLERTAPAEPVFEEYWPAARRSAASAMGAASWKSTVA